MPFIALNRSTGERVDITKIEHPRLHLKSDALICQLCEQPVIIKAGLLTRPHFAHRSHCSTDYHNHPESIEHLLGKEMVARGLKEEFAEYAQADIQYEVKVPEVKRVIDVMASFPNGWRVAHEIQLAGITTEELQQRTEDYARAGIDVVWWLGKSADTPANQAWCNARFGFSLSLDLGAVSADPTNSGQSKIKTA
jgi:competence CoiA-like predicted nuclease